MMKAETQVGRRPIVYVEDNAEDYESTMRAFAKAKLANPILHYETGDAAMDYLFRRDGSEISEMERPCLVLLDLNLPGTDGLDVLKAIKVDKFLTKMPVVVLTTSADERDINECYVAGANSYIQKPVDFGGLMQAIQHLKHYWFELVIFPVE